MPADVLAASRHVHASSYFLMPKLAVPALFRLLERGVICDWRDPNVIRVAPVPLYNTFEEVFRFSQHLGEVLREIP